MHIGCDLSEVDGMKVCVAVGLHIWSADTGIAHDGAGAARFHGRGCIAVAIVVLRMIGAHLMAHLVGHIIHYEGITGR